MAEIRIEDAPAPARPFYDKGIAALERNNLDYAMDMFTAALAVEPRLLAVRKLLRTAAIKKTTAKPTGKIELLKASGALMKVTSLVKKKPIQALERAEQFICLAPLNLKFAKAHCNAALAADLPEAAILTLEFLKQYNAADLAALQQLADLYQQAEQFEQELESREKITELNPNDTIAIKRLKDAAARLTMEKSDWKDTSV